MSNSQTTMPSTRQLAILSLFLSIATLSILVAGLTRSSRQPQAHTANVIAPLLELENVIERARRRMSPEEVGSEWLRLNRYHPHTYTHAATGLTFDFLHEFELRTKRVEGGELILVEHPSTGMAFQFFIQPINMVVDVMIMERLLNEASAIPRRAILGYNQDGTLGSDSQIPVLKMWVSEEGIGEYREAWFVHNGHLFQLTMVNAHTNSLEGWFNGMVHQNIYFPDSHMIIPGRTDLEGNLLPPRNITPGTEYTPENIL